MRFIRQSRSRLQRFQECIVTEKIECKASLSLDVPTRWNSTYKMPSTACNALIGEFQRHGYFLFFFGGEFLHVRCVSHILNLQLNVVGKSTKRV